MDEKAVKAEVKNSVLWIRLNRPDVLNAFNEEMGTDLHEALKDGEKNPKARAIVLTGEGRAFSVGEDLNTSRVMYESGKPLLLGEVLRSKYNPIVARIRRMDKPVLAAINGRTAGAGLGLALACDLRAASEKATLRGALSKGGTAAAPTPRFWATSISG